MQFAPGLLRARFNHLSGRGLLQRFSARTFGTKDWNLAIESRLSKGLILRCNGQAHAHGEVKV